VNAKEITSSSGGGAATLKEPATPQFSHHVSVPSNEGVRVEKVVTIERPVEEVYAYWRELENLPSFMRHLKSVSVIDDLHSHWAATTLGGKMVEWDAEIIEQRENEMISWRSTPGADVDNAGSVWFTPLSGNIATVVRVALKYVPPKGKAADAVASLFGRDVDSEIEEDLERLKSLLETGELPDNSAFASWPRRAAEAARNATTQARTYFYENPLALIGCAAAIGLFLGLIIGGPRRRPPRPATKSLEKTFR
jgi:uncharacterized membrane protein